MYKSLVLFSLASTLGCEDIWGAKRCEKMCTGTWVDVASVSPTGWSCPFADAPEKQRNRNAACSTVPQRKYELPHGSPPSEPPQPPPPPSIPPLTAEFANSIVDAFANGEVSWEAGTTAVNALGNMVMWLAPSSDGNATDGGEGGAVGTADKEVKAAVLNAVNTVLDALGSLQETGAAPTVIASDALVMALEKRYSEDVAAAPFEIDTPGETRRRLAANNQSVDNKVVVGVPAEALGNDSSVQAKMFLASGDVRGAKPIPGLSLEGPTLSFTLKGDNGIINVSGTPKPIEISIPTTGHGKKVTVGESNGLSRFSNLQVWYQHTRKHTHARG